MLYEAIIGSEGHESNIPIIKEAAEGGRVNPNQQGFPYSELRPNPEQPSIALQAVSREEEEEGEGEIPSEYEEITVPCEMCGEQIPFSDYENHLSTHNNGMNIGGPNLVREVSERVEIPCEFCGCSLRAKDYEAHASLHREEEEEKRREREKEFERERARRLEGERQRDRERAHRQMERRGSREMVQDRGNQILRNIGAHSPFHRDRIRNELFRNMRSHTPPHNQHNIFGPAIFRANFRPGRSFEFDHSSDEEPEEEEGRPSQKEQLPQRFSNLPVIEFSSQGQIEKEQCSVCMELFDEKEQVTLLPCFHKYHPNCIKKWLEQKNKCPVCKNRVIR
jgi:hypothetical protein